AQDVRRDQCDDQVLAVGRDEHAARVEADGPDGALHGVGRRVDQSQLVGITARNHHRLAVGRQDGITRIFRNGELLQQLARLGREDKDEVGVAVHQVQPGSVAADQAAEDALDGRIGKVAGDGECLQVYGYRAGGGGDVE